mmetsp:Transcript_6057/g.9150  ORF Transcript_6057/g.9150 Transcript_6057/m.9150 type:complete len:83 (+) Transcript_6057:373-621(+)
MAHKFLSNIRECVEKEVFPSYRPDLGDVENWDEIGLDLRGAPTRDGRKGVSLCSMHPSAVASVWNSPKDKSYHHLLKWCVDG